MKLEALEFEELDRIRIRLIILGGVVILIFSLLASRLWFLQISEGQKYTEFSQGNRIRLIPEPALRGIIYDRNGVILAENRPAYQLQLIREDTPDLEASLQKVSKSLDLSYSELKNKIEENHDLAQFKPIILEEDLSYEKAMYLETFQDDFPGVSIVIQPRRFYPYKELASHLIGYVGIVQEDWKKLPEKKRSSSQIVGHAGIELLENDHMIGLDGGRQAEVDHMGRELKILGQPVPSVPGKNVSLSIDIRLQRIASEAMQGESGAVVVMNPKTGDILALASYPDFDPNLFSGGIDKNNWNSLLNNHEHPLENKAIQGLYAPGSIFKVVTAYAGLDLGVITPETEHVCNGFYYVKGRSTPFKCWKKGGHGRVTLVDAIKGSCNVYFYNTGMGVGVDAIHKYANLFGLGQITGVGLQNEKTGLIPSSSWKKSVFKEPWYAVETPSMAIGQGYIITTPLQIINMINILANDGMLMPPKLFLDQQGVEPRKIPLKEEYLKLIREGMVAVVNEIGGTARKVQFEEFTVAGKTATSQVISFETMERLDDESKAKKQFQNHAWFVAFGPAEDPEISVLALVEHGGGGSKAAAPVVRKILSYYIDNIYKPGSEKHQQSSSKSESSKFSERLKSVFN
ncbi:MAG: penicillin-binding protein 2 [SAR324 cluster bacterium]|nr:penicillin-binding protein 2 [SAR324 cluster bacterium]MBL7034399.1 penicillin-binding protein 2 [SAR324 cluster bacterium]